MFAGLNVNVIGVGYVLHNTLGRVIVIGVGAGWFVIYLHLEGFQAIPNAYIIVAAASIRVLSPCLFSARRSPSSTKYCCHSSIFLCLHVMGHCMWLHRGVPIANPMQDGHLWQCGVSHA